jgi:hypothetical protein
VVTVPLARGPRGRSTWPSASAPRGRYSWPRMVSGWTGTAPGGSFRKVVRRTGTRQGRHAPHAQTRVHHRGAGRRGPAARRAGSRLTRRSPDHNAIRPGPRQPGPARHIHRRRLCRGRRPVTVTPARKAPDRRPGAMITFSDPSVNANRRQARAPARC